MRFHLPFTGIVLKHICVVFEVLVFRLSILVCFHLPFTRIVILPQKVKPNNHVVILSQKVKPNNHVVILSQKVKPNNHVVLSAARSTVLSAAHWVANLILGPMLSSILQPGLVRQSSHSRTSS